MEQQARPAKPLTERQKKVAEWLYAGLPKTRTAKKVKCSLRSVKTWAKLPGVIAYIAQLKANDVEAESKRVYNAQHAAEIAAERKVAEADFWYFCKFVLGFNLLEERIHKPLCDALADPANTRMTIMLPRGWFKSTVGAIAYPIWRAVKNPDVRIAIIQNSAENAKDKLSQISQQFDTNQKLRTLWPERLPGKKQRRNSTRLDLPRTQSWPEPTFYAAGVRTKVVSKHFNIIIEDDTAAPELADLGSGALMPTADQVSQAIGWHGLAGPLLTPDPSDKIIVIGTRWFEHDLLSEIHTKPEKYIGYVHFQRAAQETDGKSDSEGEYVWPELWPQERLEREAAVLGPYFYSALYLNDPVPNDQLTFRPDWISSTFFDLEKLLPSLKDGDYEITTTMDPANDPLETKGKPDYTAVVTTARHKQTGDTYVLSAEQGRLSTDKVLDLLFGQMLKWSPSKVGIESIGLQRTLIKHVHDRSAEIGRYFNVEGLHLNKGSKEARIMGLQPIFSSGRMHLQPNQKDLIAQLTGFPRTKYDDLADALAMHLALWGTTWAPRKIVEKSSDNPLLVENIIAGIKRRNALASRPRSPVMDVFSRRRRR